MQDDKPQPSVTLKEDGGQKIIYTLPASSNPARESVLYFSLPKAGNIMLSTLMGDLAAVVGTPLVYIIGEFYQHGIPLEKMPASTADIFLPRGYCYGFPGVPGEFTIPILGQVPATMLVRDPRDMAVSMYFSTMLSHPAPGAAKESSGGKADEMPRRAEALRMDIDTFIRTYCGFYYRDLMSKFIEVAALPRVRIFRYEDVIYAKRRWADDICAHYGWEIPAEVLDQAVSKIDVFPDKEKPADHVRQVHPGNYKAKLQPETIRWIEDTCAKEMDFFGYRRDA